MQPAGIKGFDAFSAESGQRARTNMLRAHGRAVPVLRAVQVLAKLCLL